MQLQPAPSLPRRFSPRERQIIDALLAAKAVKDIARELELSINTVKDYLKSIYRKAQVHSARELMVQFGHSSAALPDTALAQLLHAAQSLAPSALPSEVLAQLSAAVRRCTRAQRVSFWRQLGGPGEAVWANDTGGPSLRLGAFARRVQERGWARLEPAELQGPDGRLLAAAGLRGEVIGVRCTPTARVQFLLASDPAEGEFAPLDLPSIRLLARLASSGGERRLSLGASA